MLLRAMACDHEETCTDEEDRSSRQRQKRGNQKRKGNRDGGAYTLRDSVWRESKRPWVALC